MTQLDIDTLRTLVKRCDLYEPLEPDDERNIDFDAVPEEQRPRGDAWAARLERTIVGSLEPTCVLLTGLPGSGKSTELMRLSQRLAESFENGHGLFPVYIAADEFISTTDPVDAPDLLLGILYQVERRVLEAEGENPDKAGKEGPFKRLWHWLTTTDVTLKELPLPIPADAALGQLVFELKSQPSLRAQVRQAAASHLKTFHGKVCAEIEKLVERVRALERGARYRDLVIIVDSLEKLRGSSSNWDEVLDSAEQLFQDGAPLLRLPAHTLYTVPVALVARNIRDIEFMPMIKVKAPDGARFEPGIQAMRNLVERRISAPLLEQLLGPTFEQRVDQAIEWSAGYPRDLLRFLLEVLKSPGFPVSERSWRRIRNRIHDDYQQQVRRDALAWLARVHVNKYLMPDDDDQRKAADRMLQANVVLHYCNEHSWYDVHPAIVAMPGFDAFVARARASEPSDGTG